MKNKFLINIIAITMITSVGSTILAPTISAKATTSIESKTIKTINDVIVKYNLNESDFIEFKNLVNEDLNNISQSERGPVSTIKNALKIILKYADKLPSWISKPLKTLFQPLMNALDKVIDVSLSGLKKIMISVGFNASVADFIIDIIDLFFL